MKKISSNRRAEGRTAEERAASFLKRRGYRFLDRNVYTPFGEMDLLFEKDGFLVVVEVKFRRHFAKGGPLEAVSFEKQKRLARSAAFYLAKHFQEPVPVRFDVVAVGPEKDWLGRYKVVHFAHAFVCEENLSV